MITTLYILPIENKFYISKNDIFIELYYLELKTTSPLFFQL